MSPVFFLVHRNLLRATNLDPLFFSTVVIFCLSFGVGLINELDLDVFLTVLLVCLPVFINLEKEE